MVPWRAQDAFTAWSTITLCLHVGEDATTWRMRSGWEHIWHVAVVQKQYNIIAWIVDSLAPPRQLWNCDILEVIQPLFNLREALIRSL